MQSLRSFLPGTKKTIQTSESSKPFLLEDDSFEDESKEKEFSDERRLETSCLYHRLVFEKKCFEASSKPKHFIYPQGTKFTVTEIDLIYRVFPRSKFLVSWEETLFSWNKSQYCILTMGQINLPKIQAKIAQWIQEKSAEKILFECVSSDRSFLYNQAIFYYLRIKEHAKGFPLECRYRMIDSETVHSMVVVIYDPNGGDVV